MVMSWDAIDHSNMRGKPTCQNYENRALCDTVLKFSMMMGQVMRFSETIGFRLPQLGSWWPVAEKFKLAANNVSASVDRASKCNTTFPHFRIRRIHFWSPFYVLRSAWKLQRKYQCYFSVPKRFSVIYMVTSNSYVVFCSRLLSYVCNLFSLLMILFCFCFRPASMKMWKWMIIR